MNMGQHMIDTLIAVCAFVWPIIVALINRATLNGRTEERLKNIEQDVKEIRDLFVLTLRGPQA